MLTILVVTSLSSQGMFSAGSRVLHSATQFTEAPVHFEQVRIIAVDIIRINITLHLAR